ncbi:MAG: HAMP domain-containing sensor histidine kinase [Pseudomonadota bacterium]
MKRFRDWSLGWKLSILPLLTGLGICLIGLLILMNVERKAVEEALDIQSTFARLEVQLNLIGAQIKADSITFIRTEDFRQALADNYETYQQLSNNSQLAKDLSLAAITPKFQQLSTSLNSLTSQTPLAAQQSLIQQEARALMQALSQHHQAMLAQNDIGVRTLFWLAIAATIIAAIIAILLVAPPLQRTTKTITSLRQASIDIGEGRDEADVPIDSDDELGQLVQAFNHMHTQLREHETNTQEMLKELEEAKETAEKARQLQAEFLSNMSHELRTPMHAILNFANIGESKAERAPREKSRHYFSRIAISGRRLLNLLDDLLDMAKLEAGQMNFQIATSDLKDTVENAVAELEPLLRGRSLKIKKYSTEVDTAARFDPDKIFQVITNLLSNAIKFSPEGKTITISYHADTLKQGRRRSDTGRLSALRIIVSDEGAGIPEEELEQVFDKFFQSSRTKTGAGGTGLGLAICKEIIEKHGGTIQAENNEKTGCSFSFLLPREPSIISVEHAPTE